MKTKSNTLLIVVSLIVVSLILIVSYFSRKEAKEYQRKQNTAARAVWKYTSDSIYSAWQDSIFLIWIEQKQKRDSVLYLIYNDPLLLADAKVARDEISAEWYLSGLDQDGILSLASIYRYFQTAKIINGDICLSEVMASVGIYVGYKHSIDRWETSMKKAIKKFSPALSLSEKVMIAISLSANADLFSSLTKLNDDDLADITKLLDVIVSNQDKEYTWIYTKSAKKVLLEEYDILAKVWAMPELVKGGSTKGITSNDHGYYYILGKDIESPWGSRRNTSLVWNTRYLNRYQYAIGIFHRRCLELRIKNPEEKREILSEMARIMNEAAKELLSKGYEEKQKNI